MDIVDVLETVRDREKRLRVARPADDPIVADLRERFGNQNVRIEADPTADAYAAALFHDGRRLGAVGETELRRLATVGPGGPGERTFSPSLRTVLAHLKETTFASFDVEQMHFTSREIEDRAVRVGRGTLHAGFQRLSRFESEAARYAALPDRLDVHVYGIPDVDPPSSQGVEVHGTDADEIARTWLVAFDGGDDRHQASALLAEERENRSFYGVWTYDPDLVDRLCAYLQCAYVGADN